MLIARCHGDLYVHSAMIGVICVVGCIEELLEHPWLRLGLQVQVFLTGSNLEQTGHQAGVWERLEQATSRFVSGVKQLREV